MKVRAETGSILERAGGHLHGTHTDRRERWHVILRRKRDQICSHGVGDKLAELWRKLRVKVTSFDSVDVEIGRAQFNRRVAIRRGRRGRRPQSVDRDTFNLA